MTEPSSPTNPGARHDDVLSRSDGRSVFGQDAAGYHQSRPGYPTALFDNIRARLAPNPEILEIGAGTGLASANLLKFPARHLTIVEPDSALCDFLRDRFQNDPVTVEEAVFPDVDLRGQFDLVACAAAFHWLEPVEALAKIRSLLVPGGIWAMWWNCYFGHHEADPLAERAAQLFRDEGIPLPPSYNQGTHYALDREHRVGELREAGFTDIEHALYRTKLRLTPEQAVALYATFSFIRVLPPTIGQSLLEKISAIVSTELAGETESSVVCSLYSGANPYRA